MSGVACEDARTSPTPPPRPRLQFSVGNTGFLHSRANIHADIPHLPHSNPSLKFLKRFMQAFPTSLTLFCAVQRPSSASSTRDVCRFPSLAPISNLHTLPQFRTHSRRLPVHTPQAEQSPRSAPSTPQISSISRSTRRLPPHIPLRRQARDKPSHNPGFVSPAPLQRDKASHNPCFVSPEPPSETNQADIAEFGSHSRPN